MTNHVCTEEHERAVEAAARRELMDAIYQILTDVEGRLLGDTDLTGAERDALAARIQDALRVGGYAADQADDGRSEHQRATGCEYSDDEHTGRSCYVFPGRSSPVSRKAGEP